MPSNLTVNPNEESTLAVTATFTDEASQEIMPVTLSWKLTDEDGNVINSRSSVSITPATSVTVVLSGDDLALQNSSDEGHRAILFIGTYDSSLGNGLPLNDEARFIIENLWTII